MKVEIDSFSNRKIYPYVSQTVRVRARRCTGAPGPYQPSRCEQRLTGGSGKGKLFVRGDSKVR